MMLSRTDWLDADERKVLVVNDLESERNSAVRSLSDALGAGWTVVGHSAYQPAIDYLRENPDFFAALCDQRIPMGGSGPDASVTSSAYGDQLIREAAEMSEPTGLPQLLVQWTSSPIDRISEGPSRACPIFGCECGVSLFPEMLLRWLELVRPSRQGDDLVALAASDAQLGNWLSRGEKAWNATNTSAFLCKVHDCRHDALSPYLAVYNDIQNIDYWRSDEFVGKFGETDSQKRVSGALAIMAANANRAHSDKTLPLIGGLLAIEMPDRDRVGPSVGDYIRSGASQTLEPVVIDDGYSIGSNDKSVSAALDDALQAEQSLRTVCAELADTKNARQDSIVGRDELGGRFEQHFEELRQSLEVIVQFFEKRFRDP